MCIRDSDKALTKKEIIEIENQVNEIIKKDIKSLISLLPQADIRSIKQI